jgi:uncharacterized Zn-binding protein involved in type VI secretion
MPPAARLKDEHTCPLVDVLKPHVGGPIEKPGVPSVIIGDEIAAVVGDVAICKGPPDAILEGSSSVMIGYRPAARMGDMTVHGGVISTGCFSVIIGD